MTAHLGASATRPEVEIVMPMYRPDPLALPDIITAATSQQGVSTRLTVLLDGPYEPVEQLVNSLISEATNARLIVRPSARSDMVTRGSALGLDTAAVLVLIDDDVMAPPDLATRHLAALDEGHDIVMGRLQNVVPPPRHAQRPAALAYERWYQHDRKLWLASDAAPYWNFWAGNMSLRRETLAAIHMHMPHVSGTYNFDSFYGLIAQALGLSVVYRDDITATHVVRKPAANVLSIGYRSGRSTALFRRAGIDPNRTERDAIPLAKLRALPFGRRIVGGYIASPEPTRARILWAAERANALGLDHVSRLFLELGQMLERARGFDEHDRSDGVTDQIAEALRGARLAAGPEVSREASGQGQS